jgi:hypothetical protein
MFACKARNLPQCVSSEKCFNEVGSGTSRKLKARLKKLARDKHVSLLWGSISVNDETFYNIAPVCGFLFNKKLGEKIL